jgi:trehalose-6-phosphatase
MGVGYWHEVHLLGQTSAIAKLKKKINKEMKDLFDYTPGVNPEDKPPMYTFNVDEAKIKEHKL